MGISMRLDEAQEILKEEGYLVENTESIIHVGSKLMIDVNDYKRPIIRALSKAVDDVADQIASEYTVWFTKDRPQLKEDLKDALSEFIKNHIDRYMV